MSFVEEGPFYDYKNMIETYFGEIGYSTEKSFPGIKILLHATKTGVKAVVIADAFVAGISKNLTSGV